MDEVETVFQAINALHGDDMMARQRALDWLVQFSRSDEAWQVCDRVINDRRSPTSVMFAAQTLRRKIMEDFRQLPASWYCGLRDSLVRHLLAMDCTESKEDVLITQLSLCLIDLYLQVDQWKNYLSELVQKFSGDGNTIILLKLLQLFNEELNNYKIRIGKNRRDAVELELALLSDDVVKYLGHICQVHSTDKDIVRRSILALASWLTNRQLRLDAFAQNPIITSTMNLFVDPGPVDEDLLSAGEELILSSLEAVQNKDDNILQECPYFAKYIYDGIFSMVDGFRIANERKDCYKVEVYGRLFQGVIETFLDFVLFSPSADEGFGNVKLLDLVMLIVENGSYELVDLTFNAWFRMSESIFHGSTNETAIRCNTLIRPYVKRFVKATMKHCRYDEDLVTVPDPDDDFTDFRNRVSETMKDVLFVIGTTEFMQVVAGYMSEVENTWTEVEVAVFFLSAIMFSVTPTEDTYVPEMLGTVVRYSGEDAHPALLVSMTDFLENSEEWVRSHPEYLQAVVHWLFLRLCDDKYAERAAQAIFTYSKTNGAQMRRYFDNFLGVVDLCETAISTEKLALELIRACACLINDAPYEELPVKFNGLLKPQIEGLRQIICGSGDCVSVSAGGMQRVAFPNVWLDRITSVYRYVTPWAEQDAVIAANGHVPELVVQLVEETWRALLATMRACKSLNIVIESVCRAVRFVIRSLGRLSAPLINDLAQAMMDIYAEYKHSCFLYLGSILVDEYAFDPTFQDELAQMMMILMRHCVPILTAPNGYSDNPDTVDDLFRMGIRFIQRAPVIFISSPHGLCEILLQVGIKGLHVSHTEANQSICMFYSEFLNYIYEMRKSTAAAPTVERALTYTKKFGYQIAEAALNSCVLNVNGSLLLGLCDVLDTIRLADPDFAENMKKAVESLPHDTVDSAKSADLENYLHLAFRSRSKRHLLEETRKLRAYYA